MDLRLLTVVFFFLKQAATICVASIYTGRAVNNDWSGTIYYCQPSFLVRHVTINDNECISVDAGHFYETSLVFSEISGNCRAGVYLTAGGYDPPASPFFQGSCSDPDTASHPWDISPAYANVCMVSTTADAYWDVTIGGVVCLCNQSSTWTTSATLPYKIVDVTALNTLPGNTETTLPTVYVGSAGLSSMTALTIAPTEGPSTVNSDGTSDDLQRTSNKIALGVGLGIGIPTLLVGLIGLLIKCRR